jgi:competence protein ComEC
LLVEYGKSKVLLTGDIDERAMKAETNLIKRHNDADSDMLKNVTLYKAAHHGSNTSGSEAFLSVMTPRYAVVSCGKENTYGHPHGGALSLMEQSGATVLRTDLDGEIVFVTDGTSIRYLEGEY